MVFRGRRREREGKGRGGGLVAICDSSLSNESNERNRREEVCMEWEACRGQDGKIDDTYIHTYIPRRVE